MVVVVWRTLNQEFGQIIGLRPVGLATHRRREARREAPRPEMRIARRQIDELRQLVAGANVELRAEEISATDDIAERREEIGAIPGVGRVCEPIGAEGRIDQQILRR